MNLRDISTSDLVEELKGREGVETRIAYPYEPATIEVEGSAVVLIVED